MARAYGGLKWWQWLVVVGWGGATVNMVGPPLGPSELGIALASVLATYLIVYGLRWLWGIGKNTEEEEAEDGDRVAPGGGIVSDTTPEQQGSR